MPRTGVANYIRELVRAWDRFGADVPELVVAATCPDEFGFLGGGGAVRVNPVGRHEPGAAGRIAALHFRIPEMARAVGADVILSPNFISPILGKTPTAVVVQDLAFVHFSSTIPILRRMYYHALVRASIRGSSAVLVATRAMSEEVAEFEPSDPGTPEKSRPGAVRTRTSVPSFSRLSVPSSRGRGWLGTKGVR